MNKRQKEMLQELLDSKNNKIKHLQSVINKAIDIVEKEISNYGSDKYLDDLLEILRSKDE